jgi:dihydrofolate synthase/folylpolyglutamate synthase
MNYQDIIGYLFGLQRFGIKLGLENIRALLKPLGNPQNRWSCIHIAGTNGKGSTAAMLESVLLKAGHKVGLYTSPHLVDFKERIRINRNPIPQEDVVEFTVKTRSHIEQINPSFFEVTTAMAFWYFAKNDINIAILESGLGGRLDSTNVVTPIFSLITPIDYDHQKYLGNNLSDIAFEKAGIIKPRVTCLTNNKDQIVNSVLEKKCKELGAEFLNVYKNCKFKIGSLKLKGTIFDFKNVSHELKNIYINLAGEYQVENALLALEGLLLFENELGITESHIYQGFEDIVWRGRIDLVSREPNIVIDVSHNASGFEKTLTFLKKFFPKEKINVITFLQEDKDSQKIGELLNNHTKNIFITNIKLGKPADPSFLCSSIKEQGGSVRILDTFEEAEERISEERNNNNLWLIIGSHYLAGEAYKKLQLS